MKALLLSEIAEITNPTPPYCNTEDYRRPEVERNEDREDKDRQDDESHAPRFFGEWVRRRRKALGMNQQQLAEKMGVKQPNISRMEKNYHQPYDRPVRPDLDTVYKVARALNAPDEEALLYGGYVVGSSGVIITDPFADDTESLDRALPVRQEIGLRLQRARGARGLSLQDVARKIGGVTAETINRWERGVTGVYAHRLRDLASLYRVSADWLLYGKAPYEDSRSHPALAVPEPGSEAAKMAEMESSIREMKRLLQDTLPGLIRRLQDTE